MSAYHLQIHHPDGKIEARSYGIGSAIIGRDSGDLPLPDDEVSRRHAELRFDGARLLVRDLGSTNGTKMGGQRIAEEALSAGQTFQVGRTHLTVARVEVESGDKTIVAQPAWNFDEIRSQLGHGAPATAEPHPGGPQERPARTEAPAAAAMSAAAAAGDVVRFRFSGTGGELLRELLVGALLLAITAGIYFPWFICKLQRYVASRTTLGPTPRGDVQLSFDGQGGELFGTWLKGMVLTLLTLGIYGAWFLCDLIRFFTGHTHATASDGSDYRLVFRGEGKSMFLALLGGYLLTLVTVGIYAPWFVCKLNALIARQTDILRGGQKVGGFDFLGRGGELLVLFLKGYLLTLITAGIYMPWLQVAQWRFFSQNARVEVEGRAMEGDFTGGGKDLFLLLLKGMLLSLVTLGIYGFWLLASLIRFQTDHETLRDIGRAGTSYPAAA